MRLEMASGWSGEYPNYILTFVPTKNDIYMLVTTILLPIPFTIDLILLVPNSVSGSHYRGFD